MTGTIAPDPDPGPGPGQSGPLPFPAVRNSYDAAGRLTKVEQGALAAWLADGIAPASWTGFTVHRIVDTAYDALDRKTREAVSGGGVTSSVTEYSYDLAGRLKCTAQRMNPDAWATPLADKCVGGYQYSNGEDVGSTNTAPPEPRRSPTTPTATSSQRATRPMVDGLTIRRRESAG